MTAGRLLLLATLSVVPAAALSPVARAEDAQEVETGKHTFIGEINANNVYIRCRASDDAYATQMLKKGDRVTVVGVRFNWLKILPPEGSFAYVPQSYIHRHADGNAGRATREMIAKAGSSLNELAATPMGTVHENEEVQILGEHNEYFKIKPPEGSYLYVNKQFVNPVETVTPKKGGPETLVQESPGKQPSHKQVAKAPSSDVGSGSGVAPPATQPSGDNTDVAEAPTTQPTPDSIAEYSKLESQFKEASTKPIADQPLPELLEGYQKIEKADDLPDSMRQIVKIRLATLKVRNDARDKLLAVKQEQQKMADQRQSLVAERQEIEERIQKNDVQLFAAVGTLRPSSLQVGQGTLYRLTDPATGRTVAYVRTSDAKYGGFLGQFIGVKGKLTRDPQLKAIVENPTDVKPVEPSKVNVSVAAEVVPPSLALRKTSQQASTGNEQ